MKPRDLASVLSQLQYDTMFSSKTQTACSDLYDRIGRPLSLGLGRDLPGPYQALLDSGQIDSAQASWLPVGEQLKLADSICVAFGMYDAHDMYKQAIQNLDLANQPRQPWHQQVVEVLDNVLTTQRNTSNSPKYREAMKTLRDEAVAMPQTSEGVKSLRYQEFNQRQDSAKDQWLDFLGILAQAGLVDALWVIYEGHKG